MYKCKNIRIFVGKANMNRQVFYIFLLISSLFIISCGIDSSNNENKSDDNTIETNKTLNKQINIQNFFNTIPPAIELLQIINEAKLHYNPTYLSNPNKYQQYSLEKSRAFNLGVYGADLAISGLFNQSQQTISYLKCTNYLAKELGISTTFDENVLQRLENNKDNRDSTLEIISEIFKKADKLFSENKRDELSTYMIAGAFIESMYVTGEYALSRSNDTLYLQKIMKLYTQQSESLSYLINLLQITIGNDDATLKQKLVDISSSLKTSSESIENFKQTHNLLTELRNQIINVY